MKLMSCSRKKVIVYESIYTLPLSLSASQLANQITDGQDERVAPETRHPMPTHVQSIMKKQ
jgi:hypothetical protein